MSQSRFNQKSTKSGDEASADEQPGPMDDMVLRLDVDPDSAIGAEPGKIVGMAGAVIYGTNGDDVLKGTMGDDTIDGLAGNDTMGGWAGNDTYYVRDAGDMVIEDSSPLSGRDAVMSYIDNYTLPSYVEDLTLLGQAAVKGTGNELNNQIIGNDLANILDGKSGADTMQGGAGDDTYYVDNGGDRITEKAGDGTDSVHSLISYTLGNYVENLTLDGSAAINGTGNELDNYITGNSANNTLTGAGGNDTLNGGAGVDTMQGGTGDDTYYVDNAADRITENPGEGTDSVYSSAATYALSENIEKLYLVEGSAAVSGTGNDGNNIITGNSANNTLIGMGGNDTLNGGAGMDTMNGGAGDDTYYVDNENDLIYDADGIDTVYSSALSYFLGKIRGVNLENLTLIDSAIEGIGNNLNNIMIGNNLANILNGSHGADTMQGRAGNDTYYVDDPNDVVIEKTNEGDDTVVAAIDDYRLGENFENLTLEAGYAFTGYGNDLANKIIGNANRNYLYGEGGDDTIDGGGWSDDMYGGTGNDTYVFGLGDGRDTIEDSSGTDRMLLDRMLFSSNVSKAGIAFFRNGQDLVVGYGINDTVTVTQQMQDNHALERFELSNGLSLNNEDIGRVWNQVVAFAKHNGISLASINDVKTNTDLMGIITNAWH